MRRVPLGLAVAALVAAGCHSTLSDSYKPSVFAHYKVEGEGKVKAGPYEIDWTADGRDQVSESLGDCYGLPTGTTLIVRGPRKPGERLRLNDANGTVDGVLASRKYGNSYSYQEVEPNVPTIGQRELFVDTLPTKATACVMFGKIVRVLRVWDVVHMKGARRLSRKEPNSNFYQDSWAFDPPGPGTSELGLIVETRSVPHNSAVIAIDLSPLSAKYHPLSWSLTPTETTAGPAVGRYAGSGAGSTSGSKEKWIARIAPEAPATAANKDYPEFFVRYYVDLVLAEYPFSYELKVTPSPVQHGPLP